ncbi:MAG: Na+/H+ antiporter NhaA [Bacillota bacterium]
MHHFTKRFVRPFEEFFAHEAAGGIVLIVNTILALLWVNSPFAHSYEEILSHPVTIGLGDFSLTEPIHLWINDGLMAIFFFVVGMEIKREILVGELNSLKKSALPVAAAFGGMVLPAAIYLSFNAGGAGASGWGIPMATDIAFALGALSLLGRAMPRALAVFLTALAIVDDLGAVLVIAVFYTAQISWQALAAGGVILLLLFTANRAGVRYIWFYLILGLGLWLAFLKSGVHATIAGVLLGMTIPLKSRGGVSESPLRKLEHALHPWVAFGIMPVFALANAGVELNWHNFGEVLANPVTLGIVAGLFIGKQAGITAFSYLTVRLGLAALPDRVTWKHIYGAGILGGIGFTMSLFIASLAFKDGSLLATAKTAIIMGSLVSGIAGIIILKATGREKAPVVADNMRQV